MNVLKLLLCLLVSAAANKGQCSNLTYPSFPPDVEQNFTRSGEAYIQLRAIQVTVDVVDEGAISDVSGRIVYRDPIRLWDKQKVGSFNSTFVLNIAPESDPPGDGLAFVLTRDWYVPENSSGQWLGIVNGSTNGSSDSNIVAVEFDTKKSFEDDLDNNHIGVNINSINSIEQASLNDSELIIASGKNLTAMIFYDGDLKTLNVSVFEGNLVRSEPPILSISNLDLSQYLPEQVYAGFSASTGPVSYQRNCIREWYFTIDSIGEDKVPGSGSSTWWIWIVISVGVVVSLCGVGGYLWYKRKKKLMLCDDGHNLPIFSGVGPKKFKLKELKAATENFNQKNELGRGGFGVVYKGNLEGQLVAVKRVKDTPKGMQNLIAEVTTIGSLHHKNLVELIGWCYEGSQLLLVYEYMHNKSLDKLLYSNDSKLSWKKRYGIISGIAQALDYLHNECLKRVLHRDIKASNIMLDSEFNARLGDFGLARMFKLSEKTHHSTKEIAGTPGYMAPELFLTGKASTETDIFAFGVLALVITSGRRTGAQQDDEIEQNEFGNTIIDWVWKLYSSGMLIDAVDPKLKGQYDETQVRTVLLLGLACCHPNPNLRPSMGYVMQVLIGEASLPSLPAMKPAFVWPAPSPSFFHQDSNSFSGGIVSTFSTITGR